MTSILKEMQIEEWQKHRGMSKEEAMKKYTTLVTECCPGWRLGWIKKRDDKERDKDAAGKALMWVVKLSLDDKYKVRALRIMQGCNDTVSFGRRASPT